MLPGEESAIGLAAQSAVAKSLVKIPEYLPGTRDLPG